MAPDEASRLELYHKLEETIGHDPATTLMEYLPPTGWADVATKADLAALQAATKAELAAFKVEMDGRFDRIDARFDRMETRFARIDARFDRMETRFEVIDARFELVGEHFEALEHKVMSAFRAEVLAAITAQTRAFVIATLGFLITFSALLVALRK
jgi:hypothetical protein